MTPHRIIIVALGSHGDVHPFVGIGLRLQQRGHEVFIIANGHFRSLVERAGLGFLELGTDDEYRRLTSNADLWHSTRGFKVVFQEGVLKIVMPMYELIRQHVIPGRTLMVGSSLALGARLAQDKLGVPLATVHLSPAIFRSMHETALLPGLPLKRTSPRWLKRLMFGIADALVVEPLLRKPINAMRHELGLAPVKGILSDWIHSPDRVIGLFPDWFAPLQPDWPAQTRLTGFPLFDERGLEPLPAALIKFLDDGPPPIAFTPGSAMWQGRKFFETSAEACRILKRRGILLTRHAEQIPVSLPAGVIHVPFAPFSELLPRVAALVHHGGIGTSAQALSCGVPQLVMAMSHDQPDNADRLCRLGVGAVTSPAQYVPIKVARALEGLLSRGGVQQACHDVKQRFAGTDPIGQTVQLIEDLNSIRAHG